MHCCVTQRRRCRYNESHSYFSSRSTNWLPRNWGMFPLAGPLTLLPALQINLEVVISSVEVISFNCSELEVFVFFLADSHVLCYVLLSSHFCVGRNLRVGRTPAKAA